MTTPSRKGTRQSRLLAGWLSLLLALPSSAFGLRPQEKSEASGLEELADALGLTVSASPPVQPSPAAGSTGLTTGLEEDKGLSADEPEQTGEPVSAFVGRQLTLEEVLVVLSRFKPDLVEIAREMAPGKDPILGGDILMPDERGQWGEKDATHFRNKLRRMIPQSSGGQPSFDVVIQRQSWNRYGTPLDGLKAPYWIASVGLFLPGSGRTAAGLEEKNAGSSWRRAITMTAGIFALSFLGLTAYRYLTTPVPDQVKTPQVKVSEKDLVSMALKAYVKKIAGEGGDPMMFIRLLELTGLPPLDPEAALDMSPKQMEVVRSHAPPQFGPGILYHGRVGLDQVVRDGEVRGKTFLTRVGAQYATVGFGGKERDPAIFLMKTEVFNRHMKEGRAALEFTGKREAGQIDPYPQIQVPIPLSDFFEIWVAGDTFQRYQDIMNGKAEAPADASMREKVKALFDQGKIKAIPGLRERDQDPFRPVGMYILQRDFLKEIPVFEARPAEKAGLEEYQAAFDRFTGDVGFRRGLAENGWVALDPERLRAFDGRMTWGMIVRESADLGDGDHTVIADEELVNGAAERALPWVEAGSGPEQVIRNARTLQARPGDLILIKMEKGVTQVGVTQLLKRAGLTRDRAVRTAIGTDEQVLALPLAAFQLLASSRDAGPQVVRLDVVVRLQDEAGNTYRLILMA